MYRAETIANYLLQLNQYYVQTDCADGLAVHRLMQLLYYAESAHLAIYEEPLLDEPIYKWADGPGVNSVWERYKKYRTNPIPPEEFMNPGAEELLDGKSIDLLISVWETFGLLSASGLRSLIQRESPWTIREATEMLNPIEMSRYFANHYLGLDGQITLSLTFTA